MYAKFYQNRRGFVEDMTKTFWYVFFVSPCIWAIVEVLNVRMVRDISVVRSC